LKLSLRQRVLVIIVAIHVAVLGAEFALLAEGLASAGREAAIEYAGSLVSTLRGLIEPAGGVNAARLLQWPGWTNFSDALVLDRNLALRDDGHVHPEGVALNPLGASGRSAEFDYETIYAAIELAVQRGTSIDDVAGGRVAPIDTSNGIWGACWYRVAPDTGARSRIVGYFALLLVGSTVLLTAGTFFALRRTVLDPVTKLTSAAKRVALGDLAARVDVPEQSDELAELSRTFNSMVGEVRSFNERLESEVQRATEQARRAEAAAMTQRRLAATGELAAGIAHEINNPLGGLLNAVERLKVDQLPPAKRAQYLDLLAGGLERIRETVGRLLRFTPRQAHRSPVRIVQPVIDAVSLVRHRAARQGVALAISDGELGSDADPLPSDLAARLEALPVIDGEAHELGQAVLNLLVNSLDALEGAAPGDAKIEIVLASSVHPALGACVVVEVRDNGPGVTSDELGRVSDLFYTTKEVGKGTGLGLAIVHNVVASHGGTVELDSSPGAGFRVKLTLPLTARREQEAN
jgi:signal transduction histidine kinase